MATRIVEVTITRTYTKQATIEVEVDDSIVDDWGKLIDYLTNNEEIDTELEHELGEASLDGGDDIYEFSDPTNNFGGHL